MIGRLLAVLVGFALAAALSAQQLQMLEFPDGTTVRARITTRFTGAVVGGYGWVDVALDNQGAAERRVVLEILPGWGSEVRVRRTVVLAPRAADRAVLQVPQNGSGLRLQIVADGMAHAPVSVHVGFTTTGAWAAFVVADPGPRPSGWRQALEQLTGTAPDPFAVFPPAELPTRWWMLSGLDLAVVDARAEGLDAAAQGLLEAWLRAGGRLVAVHGDRFADGPLRDALAPIAELRPLAPRAVGLGAVVVIPSARSESLPGSLAADRELVTALFELADPSGFVGQRASHSPVAAGLRQIVAVPGIDEVPVAPFVALMVLFAVVIGPVNRFWNRAHRHRVRMLVTTPLIGLGTAAVVLIYGLISEGTGVRGASRALAVVDQAARRTVAWEQRTLYAALGVGPLTPRSDTLLENADFVLSAGSPFAYRDDGGSGRVDGLVLARTPTRLTTASFGDGRARLRFRRLGDGGMEVLAGGDIEPTGGDADLVLFLADGSTFVGNAARLVRRDAATARAAAEAILAAQRDTLVPTSPRLGYGAGGDGSAGSLGSGALPGTLALDEAQRRGGYVARVVRAPGTDDLGLEVEMLDRFDIAVGLLGAEDIVDG